MRIENPTLVHFRHFSSLFTNLPSTTVENPLQIRLFMQNKAKFRKSQMNVNKVLTRDYEKKTLGERGKKQSQTKPNKANSKKAKMNVNRVLTMDYENISPIRAPKKQSQMSKRQKPMQTSLPQRIMKKTALSGPGKTNPNKANFKGKKCCCQGNPHASHRAGTVAGIKFVTLSLTSLGIDANLLALQFKEADLWNYPG